MQIDYKQLQDKIVELSQGLAKSEERCAHLQVQLNAYDDNRVQSYLRRIENENKLYKEIIAGLERQTASQAALLVDANERIEGWSVLYEEVQVTLAKAIKKEAKRKGKKK